MLKSRTGTERSDQTTTWARTAVADALLTENRVVTPFGLSRSTSKYGSNSVAAGTSSIVQMTATACPPRARRPRSATERITFFMQALSFHTKTDAPFSQNVALRQRNPRQ